VRIARGVALPRVKEQAEVIRIAATSRRGRLWISKKTRVTRITSVLGLTG
jgi:hypothetical protein